VKPFGLNMKSLKNPRCWNHSQFSKWCCRTITENPLWSENAAFI